MNRLSSTVESLFSKTKRKKGESEWDPRGWQILDEIRLPDTEIWIQMSHLYELNNDGDLLWAILMNHSTKDAEKSRYCWLLADLGDNDTMIVLDQEVTLEKSAWGEDVSMLPDSMSIGGIQYTKEIAGDSTKWMGREPKQSDMPWALFGNDNGAMLVVKLHEDMRWFAWSGNVVGNGLVESRKHEWNL